MHSTGKMDQKSKNKIDNQLDLYIILSAWLEIFCLIQKKWVLRVFVYNEVNVNKNMPFLYQNYLHLCMSN